VNLHNNPFGFRSFSLIFKITLFVFVPFCYILFLILFLRVSLPVETMNQLQLKEVKCETIGRYTIISSPYMDDEEDLLAWTNEFAYSASAFNAVVATAEQDVSNGSVESLSAPEAPPPGWLIGFEVIDNEDR